MKVSFNKQSFLPLVAVAFVTLLPACTALPHFDRDNYIDPLDGAAVIENDTRYSKELECLAPIVAKEPTVRFAVGRVNDFTGKEDLVNGKRITQGAALMVMSALAKAKVPMVERFDTSIADMELKYADNKLITDHPKENGNYRKIFGGSIPGSDYHIVGGITEVNYNIKSGSLDSSIQFLGASARYFVMNVGVDLRLVNTKTLQVVDVESLQKQIIGTELRGGYFRLFADGVFDINSAERTQEPIQRAVRMVIEQAVYNMVSKVYHVNAPSCRALTLLRSSMARHATASSATVNATAGATAAGATSASTATQGNQTASTPVAPNTAKAQKIQLTSPPSADAHQAQENVAIDPNTGEIVYSNNTDSPPSTEEKPALNGLIGKGVGKAPSGGIMDDPRMKEKMLWGTRPTIQ